jgi:mannosyl-3-phosphoglycerate phosphatase family protein
MLVIFTDLDGTLLDQRTYSWAAAEPALRRIERLQIPLVFCSSKTRAEITVLRERMGNAHPFISENGGGIFIPPGYFAGLEGVPLTAGLSTIALGAPYALLRAEFVELRRKLNVAVRGFGDMSDVEIAALTGLPREETDLARQRDFDEPFVFDAGIDTRFLRAIEEAGRHWTRGNLYHLMGDHDKGRAVRILHDLFAGRHAAVESAGLGDSFNDLPMLRAVDRPVLVRRPGGGFDPQVDFPGLAKTRGEGPAGWNEAVLALLDEEGGAGSRRPWNEKMNRGVVRDIFNAALEAADPGQAVSRSLAVGNGRLRSAGHVYRLDEFNRLLVVGGGKAAARMGCSVEDILGDRISGGLLVTRRGHAIPLRRIALAEAAHPVPDEAGMRATREMAALLHGSDEKTFVLCLLSGGASALLVAPLPGVTLADKQAVTGLLLKAGAAIDELNAVRKHLSAIKGGRLAKAAFPATTLTLILSDVIGDRLDVIASGPTAPDASTFAAAAAVLDKYGLWERLPSRAAAYLRRGLAGLEAETVKKDDPCFTRAAHVLVGSLSLALDAAAAKAREYGLHAEIITRELQGEARVAARLLSERALRSRGGLTPGKRLCLLAGGETTVRVRGTGRGGRNQELALAFALEIAGVEGIEMLSAGTDGTDGPTDAAGAIVDGKTVAAGKRIGMDAAAFLENNDSYSFFRELDARSSDTRHVKTGPTGTNVMDIQIILVRGAAKSGAMNERGRGSEDGDD